MLDLDFIKENTIWVVKFSGHRTTCLEKDLSKYENRDDVRDIDTACWEGQPKELQEFYRDYEYALNELNRHDLYIIDDFYREWSKDSEQFKPKTHPVIGKLSTLLETLDPCSDLIINNYNGNTAGNHRVGNFVEALQIIDTDFDVISFNESSGRAYEYSKIIVQTDDLETFKQFDYQANKMAISHDKYFGDGKYDK